MSGASLPIAVGDVLHVQEPDYKYGQRALTLRVTAVGRTEQLDDGTWVHLDGTELRDDGTPRAPEPRHVVVRARALHRLGRPQDTR
jgi:hypothetical protein